MKAKHIVSDHLSRVGIDIRTNHPIKEIKKDQIIFKNNTVLSASTIIWCGDYKPNPIVEKLGLKVDRKGAAMVNSYLQTTGDATIYALGNCASIWNVKPEVAENASSWSIIKQAKVAAHNLASNIIGGNKKEAKFKPGTLTNEIGDLTLLVRGNTVSSGTKVKIIKSLREKLWWFNKK